MMRHHPLPPTTHTLELNQLTELQARLTARGAARIRAIDLGVAGSPSTGRPPVELPAAAQLRRLAWSGPPDFPYVYGYFALEGRADPIRVDLHTEALRRLSRLLGTRQRWGLSLR